MYPLYKRPYQAGLIVSLRAFSGPKSVLPLSRSKQAGLPGFSSLCLISVFRAAIENAAMAGCGMDIESPGTGVWRGIA